jgi:hypothetical protein
MGKWRKWVGDVIGNGDNPFTDRMKCRQEGWSNFCECMVRVVLKSRGRVLRCGNDWNIVGEWHCRLNTDGTCWGDCEWRR